jgi:hypothetical protein
MKNANNEKRREPFIFGDLNHSNLFDSLKSKTKCDIYVRKPLL